MVKYTGQKPMRGTGATTETRSIPSFKSKRDNIVAGRSSVRQRAVRKPPVPATPTNSYTKKPTRGQR